MNVTNSIRVLTVAAILLLGSGCSRHDNKPPQVMPVKAVGVVIPLTGNWSPYGDQMRQGVELAIEHFNKDHAGKEVRVRAVFEDGKAEAAASTAAYMKLANVDRVPAVLSGFSGVVLALATRANEDHTVLMNAGATAPKIAEAGPFVFSSIPNAEYEARYLAEYLFGKLGYRRVGIYWQNNDAGVGMRDTFVAKFSELGGKIAGQVSHEAGQIDFRSTLEQVRQFDAQAVFIPTYSKEMGLILRQWRELGIEAQPVGYAASEVQDLLSSAQDAANGLIYSYYAYNAESQAPQVSRFVSDCRQRYGVAPGLYTATFYDGAMLIFEALLDGATTGDQIREHLLRVSGYQGVSGIITFGGQTSVTMPLQMKTVKDGSFVPLSSVTNPHPATKRE